MPVQPYDRRVPFNQLPPLPPDPKRYLDNQLTNKLALASRQLAELKGLVSQLPNQSLFINVVTLREAKASCAIEDIVTTNDALYKALSYQDEDIPEGPVREILRYRDALLGGYRATKPEGWMTFDVLISMYQTVMQSDNRLRPHQTKISFDKMRSWGTLVADTVYTPPHGEGVVEQMLEDLIEFMDDDVKYPLDPLLKVAMGHYQLEAIHPFPDGNGRTGRILCILYLIKKQLLDIPVLPLSTYILQNKETYFLDPLCLMEAKNWKRWILYMLEVISQSAEYTTHKIKQIQAMMEKTERTVRERGLPATRLEISRLIELPYIRPKNLLSDRIKSINTAKKYLTELEAAGMLTKEKAGKEYIWFNRELMNILSEAKSEYV